MKYLVALMLVASACATIKPAPQPKVNAVTFDDVKQGLRPGCVAPPKHYSGLDIMVEGCQYNTNAKMPAACVYMGRQLMELDVVMICGAVLVQETCMANWLPTMFQCSIPPQP